jgi:hypothetical protein
MGELLSMVKNCADACARLLEPPCEAWPMRRRIEEFASLWIEVMVNPGYQGIAFFYQPWWQALGILILARAVSRIVLFPFAEVQHYMPEHVDASDYLYSRKLGDDVSSEDEWLIRQLETTADLKFDNFIARAMDFLMFHGDSYQIEHHLWPAMSFINMREASVIVRDTCAEFGLPYFEITYWEGYAKIWDQVRCHAVRDYTPMRRERSSRDISDIEYLKAPLHEQRAITALETSDDDEEYPRPAECDPGTDLARVGSGSESDDSSCSRRKRPRIQ